MDEESLKQIGKRRCFEKLLKSEKARTIAGITFAENE